MRLEGIRLARITQPPVACKLLAEQVTLKQDYPGGYQMIALSLNIGAAIVPDAALPSLLPLSFGSCGDLPRLVSVLKRLLSPGRLDFSLTMQYLSWFGSYCMLPLKEDWPGCAHLLRYFSKDFIALPQPFLLYQPKLRPESILMLLAIIWA